MGCRGTLTEEFGAPRRVVGDVANSDNSRCFFWPLRWVAGDDANSVAVIDDLRLPKTCECFAGVVPGDRRLLSIPDVMRLSRSGGSSIEGGDVGSPMQASGVSTTNGLSRPMTCQPQLIVGR